MWDRELMVYLFGYKGRKRGGEGAIKDSDGNM